jgi:hypothetical protein
LEWPVVFERRALAPLAVLAGPLVLLWSARYPKAVPSTPVVLRSALVPPAVLPFASLAVGLGGPASADYPRVSSRLTTSNI